MAAAIAHDLDGTPPAWIAAGAWSTAYAFDLDGAPVVLRVGRHGEDFAKDAIIASAVTNLPVPAVYACGERDGWAYALSARASGTALDDLDAAGIEAVLPDLLDVMDQIGRIEVGGRGYGLWDTSRIGPHSSWAAALLATTEETPRKQGWHAALVASPVGIEPYRAGVAALERLTPDLTDRRCMVHGDLLARNVLVEDDRIAAVLDWGNAMFGDPLYDAAWLRNWWPWYDQWSDVDIEAAIGRKWNPDPRAIRAYQIHMALDSMMYCASRGRFDDVARNADAVLELARR